MTLTDKVRALAEEANDPIYNDVHGACREYSGILRGLLAAGVSTTDHWIWEPVVGIWRETLRNQK